MNLRTLKQIWEQLNDTVFSGVLYPPRFYRTRSRGEYASYVAGIGTESELHFNTTAITGKMARSIVYHEMIHQYIEEFLGVEENNHHGELFWYHYDRRQPDNVILFEELD
ncbi:MAG: hypothetical protein ACYSUK_11140 [Planctomycetota bacterium]|jgi:hypothetical protein